MATDEGTMEERVISEEYRVWKKNSPYLYDTVMTHALEWPSLTVQWLPDLVKKPDLGYSEQRLVMGTHTSAGEPNYVMITKVRLPLATIETEPEKLDAGRDPTAFGGLKRGDKAAGGQMGKVETYAKIPHEGEVNRARYMPQNSFVVATKAPTGDVLVFNYTSHDSAPSPMRPCEPLQRLKGHTEEGYGLEWAPLNPGHVLSGADDKQVLVWDTNTADREVKPLATYLGHTEVVEDVAWHRHHKEMFASVGDDRRLLIWDTRESGAKPRGDYTAHSAEINCVAFNPFQEFLLATGSADKTVALWDVRNMKSQLHAFTSHTDEVFQLQWSPFSESVFASSGADRRVNVWDLSRIGAEQTAEDAEDGPPELLFVHGGHTAKISDFAWNPNDEWVLASVAEDNILQIWQMASNIHTDEPYHPEDAELE